MKKVVSSILCWILVVTMILPLTACGTSIQEDWASIVIGDNLPTPQKGKLRSGSNLDNGFSGGIEKVNADYYKEYKQACIEMGYTIDSIESGNYYKAFNAEGYELSLSFNRNRIGIILGAPDELADFEWPKTGIGSLLPQTTSSLGKVTSDSSKCFRVIVGNMTIDDYDDYVKVCEQKGFVVDYVKEDSRYSAKNEEGYRLVVSYAGCNRIDVMIETPKQESDPSPEKTPSAGEDSATDPIVSDTADKVDKEFKESMDKYEEFFDEYVAFMKKYKESNGTDLSLLSDYASYITKYAEMMQEFAEWEGKGMNAAEAAYYAQVQGRITQKLLEVAQ